LSSAKPSETAAESPSSRIGAVAPQLEAEQYRVDCDKPKDRDQADLCEQRRMAQAMRDKSNLDDNLARDSSFALWRSPSRVKRGQGVDVCGLVARMWSSI
jgi:hypothetical protein